jgi:hypothetical protein
MTRQKNDIANGARLENASWRTWWQKRLKLKTVNPQKLNWSVPCLLSSKYITNYVSKRLKDSDVTWLYGPLHQAPIPILPPKGASLQDKLNTIPPLPKGRKPILKKRTLAEVLVLGLAKTNTLSNRPPADELKELDIDTRSTKGPEERDRIMLLHTKSDTNLLRPAMGRVTHPSSPSAEHDRELNSPTSSRRPAWRTEKSSFSTKASPSPPPQDTRKRVGFNTYVSQCIAIAPGERSSSDADSDEDGISMKSAGLTSHGSHHRHSLSRSNSHSSQRSEPLIIAPMAPTLLKENMEEGEEAQGPALVYMPIETPFDGKDSDDDWDFGDSKPPVVIQTSSLDSNEGVPDLGAEITMNSKKRKLSAGEIPPARRHHRTSENESSSSSLDTPDESTTTVPSINLPNPSIPREIPVSNNAPAEGETRGRTLHRTSSGSSLNERSRSRTGNSPIGSYSPSSSHASSSAFGRGSSTETGVPTRVTLGVTSSERPGPTVEPPNGTPTGGAGEASGKVEQLSTNSEGSKSSPKPETTGFVDKAVANARGLIETLLSSPASSLSNKRA